MKNLRVHLMNKYPKAKVQVTGQSICVHSASGQLLVEATKSCHNVLECNQKESGARDAFCLSPIPRSTRFMKSYEDKVAPAEEHDERIKNAKLIAKDFGGRVPCIHELVHVHNKHIELLSDEEKRIPKQRGL